MFDKNKNEIINECWYLHQSKNKKYNDGWYYDGIRGVMKDLHRKINELKRVMKVIKFIILMKMIYTILFYM